MPGRAAERAHDVFGDRARLVPAAELFEEPRLAHARLRPRKRGRDARVGRERLVGPPRRLQRSRKKKVALGRMKVRRAPPQLLERRHCVVRAAEIEERARLADEEGRFVAERLGKNRPVMLQRLLRPADPQTFLGESAPVGDRVDDRKFVLQRAIAAGRVERGRN